MPFDFTISIEGDPGKPAQFVPQGGQPGQPLQVVAADIVTWNNTTSDVHQPWPTQQDGTLLSDADVTGANAANYLSDEIQPNDSSSPAWVAVASTVTGNTIYYCCKLHPQMRGTIVLTG